MPKHAKHRAGDAMRRAGARAAGMLTVAAAGLLAAPGGASAGVGGTILGTEYEPIEELTLPGPIHACNNAVTIGEMRLEVPVEDDGCGEAAGQDGGGDEGGPRRF